ncbi:MAG: 5-formaminoimidazole-4-carboxamide-1-(beta)-D-ribofuranosyl 5'-monophosphate synthetase [Thermoplasmata archaeon]|nr:formate--phosphoribosylaminoimidazolecarboxamide ligase family protein [Thermoplasmata archaeon]RLF43941.1 MAG: 5-formaminoimidazole-4-carboxamide-1-(beta)-D-ribofuranosyl 5'-monophosphate synthetase [Thermoplasmata archaeon]RLF46895.1 MAG: 5-formaminoimidazole-4-carboxamide-1-(beta)-D-ribofuranosyl 5'-monophosphate synthetase [Thermoplasmata archaeon]
MIERSRIWDILENYDVENIKIGAVASHSALDTFDGAADEGFRTLAVCQKGREKTYTHYFKARRRDGIVWKGCVDEAWVFDKFNEILLEKNQERLIKENVIFIPNRSFTSYCKLDEIEENFHVPMFGSRNLLRTEERTEEKDYYWLLEKEGLPFPEKIDDPRNIEELSIVKLHHAVKKLERGFFTCSSYDEYRKKSEQLLKQGVITEEDLKKARIERYIIGPVFNFDFFYSPITKELELLGIDWRFETSLDGHVRLPAQQQLSLPEKQQIPEYTVCGHNSATLRESQLEKVFELGERYVEATKKHYDYGIIGPFCLQTCVDKDLRFYIYDVAPRIGGGTNVHMSVGHPYGNTLWRRRVSTGRRIAMEIKMAAEEGKLKEIVS